MGTLIPGIIAAAVGIAGVIALQLPRLAIQTTDRVIDPVAEAQAQILKGEQLNLLKITPDFGFSNLIADWTFLNFIQYFGDTPAREATDYRLSDDFFEVIAAEDPHFMDAYIFLTTATSFYTAQPEKTVKLLAQSLETMSPALPPNSYLLWRYKALDELLLLGDSQAAQMSFAQAADWAAQSPLPNAARAAELSRNTADFLKQNPDSVQAQINSWFQVWNNAVNADIQQLAESRINTLGFELVLDNDGVQVVPRTSNETPDQDGADQ